MPARQSFATPATFVGAIGARARRRRRTDGRFSRVRRRRHNRVLDMSIASELGSTMRGLVPTGRRRKRLMRRMSRRLDRISEMANGAATIVGMAAAGAELLSTLRSREPVDGAEEDTDATTSMADMTETATADVTETETDVTEEDEADETEVDATGPESRSGRREDEEQPERGRGGRTRRPVARRESPQNGSAGEGNGRRSRHRASAEDLDEREAEPEEDAYGDSEEEFEDAR